MTWDIHQTKTASSEVPLVCKFRAVIFKRNLKVSFVSNANYLENLHLHPQLVQIKSYGYLQKYDAHPAPYPSPTPSNAPPFLHLYNSEKAIIKSSFGCFGMSYSWCHFLNDKEVHNTTQVEVTGVKGDCTLKDECILS